MPSQSDEIISIVQSVLGSPEKTIGLHEPEFSGNEWCYIKECLDTGWVSSVGSYVDLFGEKLAETAGVSYAIPTVNGTAALHISLLLAGVEHDDEVLMPSLTFVATANAVKYTGAIPHFVECEEESLGIDVQKLKSHLANIAESKNGKCYNKTTGRRISTIIPVHVFGQPVDMDPLLSLCKEYNIKVVTDAAEALGSQYKGNPATSYGQITAVSFNGNKIITTGGGGAILTNDANIASRARHLTTTAKRPHKWDFVHDELGYNYRMPNINAALGCAQLEQLPSFLEKKKKLAQRYSEAFSVSENFDFVRGPEYGQSNNWLNAIRIKNNDIDRDLILEALNNAGFMCRPIWKLMHHLDMYQDCPKMDLNISEQLEKSIINVPSSAKLGA